MTEPSSFSTLSVLKTVANLGFPYEVIEIDPVMADTALFCENCGFPMQQVREHDRRSVQEGTKGFCGMCVYGNDSVGHKQTCTQAQGSLKGILCICRVNEGINWHGDRRGNSVLTSGRTETLC